MNTIIVEFLNKNKFLIITFILLLISITINIIFYSNSSVNFKKLEKKKEEITLLEMKVEKSEGALTIIKLQREETKKEIDSLTTIINKYESEKNKRKNQHEKQIKKINDFDANKSMEHFINWTNIK